MRKQAASLSREMCIIVVRGIPSRANKREKPMRCKPWKAAVLDTTGRVLRTPPGSKSGVCFQRGRSGTWESHLSPGDSSGLGDRRLKGPGVVGALRPNHEPARDTTNT